MEASSESSIIRRSSCYLFVRRRKRRGDMDANSPLEQSVSVFPTRTTAGRSQEALLKRQRCRNPCFPRLREPAHLQRDSLAGWQRPRSPPFPHPPTPANDRGQRDNANHGNDSRNPAADGVFPGIRQRSNFPKLYLSKRRGKKINPSDPRKN